MATLYTRDHGKIGALAKGARRPKSPFEAALDLLSICRVVFISKSSDSLDILTEAKLQRRFRIGSKSLLRLYCGYYVAELLDRLSEKGDQNPAIFDLAQLTLDQLEQEDLEPRCIILRFELQLLRYLGHLPSWDRCVQCGSSNWDSGNSIQNSDSWVLFSTLAGGILCENCRGGARQTVRIDAAVQSLLIAFSQPNWRDLDFNLFQPEQSAVTRKLMWRYLTFLLDSPIKLQTYLEELGR